MNDPRLPAIVNCLLLIFGLLQWFHLYPQLPGVMAAHFAENGTCNGLQPKQVFFTATRQNEKRPVLTGRFPRISKFRSFYR